MKILLLGATGLLGHNVLDCLLNRGHSVVALVRNRVGLPSAGLLTVVEGSLLDVAALRTAAQGCEAIVNCSGTTDMSLLRYDDYLPVNKVVVEYILEIMGEMHIATYVHISSANTVGYGTAGRPGTESDEIKPPFRSSFYAQSKLEAEKILTWEAQQHPERHIVILNPGFMVGPYDYKPSSGKLLLAAFKRSVMAAPGGGKSFVSVKDVANAVVNALTMGRNGERYLLTGEDMSLRDFYALQAEVCGYSQRLFVLPDWLVALAGRLGDLLRWAGKRTQLSTRNVRQLMVDEYYTSDKARRELAFTTTPLADAIRDFFEWYGKQKN
jgi:dihydroflavonol-4-reductase